MQPETRFKEKVLRDLRAIPGVWAEKIQQVSIKGTPDILACVCGIFFAIELKTDSGKLEKLQEHKLRLIAKAGGGAMVATPSTWPDIRGAIACAGATRADCLNKEPFGL